MKITPVSRLSGEITLPPDKSIAHRSALFASLSTKVSTISNYSEAADPQSTLSCLKQLGVSIMKDGSTIQIQGVGRDGFSEPLEPIDCGNSGTTMRLLTGILSGAGIKAKLIGDESLSSRPMLRVMNPLKEMGAQFEATNEKFAPFDIIKAGNLNSIQYELPMASAQVKSCVLLAGLFSKDETVVIEPIRTRDHTERLLNLKSEFRNNKKWIYANSDVEIPEQTYQIPGDFSACTFWLVAASIIENSHIIMKNVGLNPTRTAALSILLRMGADINIKNERSIGGGEPVADIEVKSAPLIATEIAEDEVANCIDELPIISVAMSFADGRSSFRGAEELRVKECDRLMAIGHILTNAGINHKEYSDGFDIDGNRTYQPNDAEYSTWHDHRIAMSATIMSLKAKTSSIIQHADCASISYPTFFSDLQRLSV